ncbi:MAG: hypothetical protein R2792_11870 [Saprospiraceae bacterium]|jgi:hypothetical protein
MSTQSEHSNQSNRGVVILLTIVLHLALGYYLYQTSTKAPQTTRMEQVDAANKASETP